MSRPKDGERYRNWATIVYPDSCNPAWLDILNDYHTEVFISPLHDQDINPTGEVKKPHYHVIIAFPGVKSLFQIMEIINAINGVGVEVVDSLRGYCRYLCHLDNPDKTQYSCDDVLTLGGADYMEIIGLPIDIQIALREMCAFIDEHKMYNFSNFVHYCYENSSTWFRVVTRNTLFIKEFIRSRRLDT